VIAVRALRYRFPETSFDALAGIDWHAAPGSFTLVAGQSGSGKSTLLRCLNGLIPHFHGGHFGGEVIVAGRDTRISAPRDLATVIGSVFQEPEAQLITDTVHDEIAFALENLGFSRREVSERLAGISARLGIEHLRERRISTLSGGERQLVALAAALAPGPPALVLDEPTSQLDPDATAALLDTLAGLHRAEGLTAVIAEHRIERLCPLADAVLHLSEGRSNLLQRATATAALESDGLLAGRGAAAFTVDSPEPGETLVELRDLRFSYGARMALDGVSLDLHAGEAVALMGPNGSGKTTLLKHLIGLLRPDAGSVLIAGQGIAGRPVHEIAASVGYVPQQPSLILHRETLRDELRFTLDALARAGDIDATLDLLGIGDLAAKHPLDLSGGERQRAAIAAIAVGSPRVLLLDEPTRGLPWSEKQRLAGSLRRFAGNGRLVVVATHDFAFAAALGGRILRLVSGRINGIEVSGIHSGARTDTVDQSKRFDRSVLTPSKAG
jgi:energy-coupling factor transport system ATP-binding protein